MRPVAEFVEKPDAARASSFIESGEYFWNSGMFLLPAQAYLDELGRLDPDMLHACRRAYESAVSDLDFVRLDKAAFEACHAESIDYAVMEKTESRLRRPARSRVERCRLLGGPPGRTDPGLGRQRDARRCIRR